MWLSKIPNRKVEFEAQFAATGKRQKKSFSGSFWSDSATTALHVLLLTCTARAACCLSRSLDALRRLAGAIPRLT